MKLLKFTITIAIASISLIAIGFIVISSFERTIERETTSKDVGSDSLNTTELNVRSDNLTENDNASVLRFTKLKSYIESDDLKDKITLENITQINESSNNLCEYTIKYPVIKSYSEPIKQDALNKLFAEGFLPEDDEVEICDKGILGEKGNIDHSSINISLELGMLKKSILSIKYSYFQIDTKDGLMRQAYPNTYQRNFLFDISTSEVKEISPQDIFDEKDQELLIDLISKYDPPTSNISELDKFVKTRKEYLFLEEDRLIVNNLYTMHAMQAYQVVIPYSQLYNL